MREILFRGKTFNDKWVEGALVKWSKAHSIIRKYGSDTIGLYEYSVVPETVGQFTGLTDKNGKKIFEWDICKFREWDNGEMCWIGYVHFEHCQFIISGGANKECPSNFYLVLSRFSSENIEVIGNIYDNPELLEVTE